MTITDTERVGSGYRESGKRRGRGCFTKSVQETPTRGRKRNHSWAWQPSQGAPADFCFFGEEEKGRARVVSQR